jgi:hypothetical protein
VTVGVGSRSVTCLGKNMAGKIIVVWRGYRAVGECPGT